MMLRRLARRAIAATPLPEVLLRHRAKQHVTVLGYHRILPDPGKDYPFNETVLSATPEEFARELRYLRENLDVISIPQLLAGLKRPSYLPERPAVITFDDGYIDNYSYAFPLLREAGLPACFFVCSGLLGTRLIPWQEAWVCCLKRSKAAKIESLFGEDDAPYELDAENLAASIRRFRRKMWQVPWAQVPEYLNRLSEATSVKPEEFQSESMFMSWDDAREMHTAGMDIGGHTRTHPILSRSDDATLLDEVDGCYDDLKQQLGTAPLAFAYPFGYSDFMSESADAAIERAGFKLNFSFIHGFASRGGAEPIRRMPRIHAAYRDDHQAFRLRMAMAPVFG